MTKAKKPSVKKISELTGFSQATVSNALNGKRKVNKETQEKIFQVAEELGYSLKNSEIHAIRFIVFRRNGLIIDNSNFHPAVIEGVNEEAKNLGLETIYTHINREDPGFDEQMDKILSDNSTGIVLLATEMNHEDFRLFSECKSPVVLLDGWSSRFRFNGVCIDNFDAAENVIQLLASKGHKRIGYVRGDFRIKAFEEREDGYRREMTRQGFKVKSEDIITVRTKTETAMQDMLRWFNEHEDRPTAFFCDNDVIAYGVLQAAQQCGLKIPEDLSVIGFDDIYFSSICSPPLTTVRVDKKSLGKAAVRRLIEMMKNPEDIIFKTEICTEIVERSSVRNLNRKKK
ncbi:MAG: LacI family DNA-binding transcriptional regulator [Lachnospiraceae bacterium]|nr:LacI family DNA-binding transcriptional regulator [Lachnospiraceae bacterium]